MNIERILEEIAKENGVTAEEVLRDINFALTAARENQSPDVKEAWANIPSEGETPSAHEVISHIVGLVIQENCGEPIISERLLG